MAKTLDVLDSYLLTEYHRWADPEIKFRIRNYTEKIVLDTPNWDKYYKEIVPYGLVWSEFKYDDIDTLKKIDEKLLENTTGFYMFILKPNNPIYDMPKNVLYVGMSGENNSCRPLKDRLKDYFNINKIKKRDAVIRMLEKYYPNIYVAFTYCDQNTAILKQIESSLIGFFYPIVNKDDFPVELKPEKKAF